MLGIDLLAHLSDGLRCDGFSRLLQKLLTISYPCGYLSSQVIPHKPVAKSHRTAVHRLAEYPRHPRSLPSSLLRPLQHKFVREVLGVLPHHDRLPLIPVRYSFEFLQQRGVRGREVEGVPNGEQFCEVADVEQSTVGGAEQLRSHFPVKGQIIELFLASLIQKHVLVVRRQFRIPLTGDIISLTDRIHGRSRRRVARQSAPTQLQHCQLVVLAGLTLAVPIVDYVLNCGKPRFHQFFQVEDQGLVETEVGDQSVAGIGVVEVEPQDPGREIVLVAQTVVIVLPQKQAHLLAYLEGFAVRLPQLIGRQKLATDSLPHSLHNNRPVSLHEKPAEPLHGKGRIRHQIQLTPEPNRSQIEHMDLFVETAGVRVVSEVQPVVVVDVGFVLGVGDVGEIGQFGDDIVAYFFEVRAFVAVEIPAGVGEVEKCEIADGRHSASARILPPQIAVLGRQDHSVEYDPVDQTLHAQNRKQPQSQQQSSTHTSAYNSFLHVIPVVIKQIQIHPNRYNPFHPQIIIAIIIAMRTVKRIGFVTFIGALTLSACSACYWQSKKYLIARQRWDVIKKELNRDEPESLVSVEDNGLYPFKYVVVRGKLKQGYVRVDRPRGGRMGYLVVRSLAFKGKQGEESVAAVEGWCEEGHQFEGYESQQKQFRGILRQKERKDYVHTHFKKTDLQTFKMQTYIDLEGLIPVLKLTPTVLAQNYYMEILKPLDEVSENLFPYKYSVDNFQLPYLTPDKHLSYACFWGGSALVGLFGIFRAIRLK